MRRIFVLLMIVLLPLRGWAGEFMDMQTAMRGADSISSPAHTMPPGCAMHAQADVAAGADLTAQIPGDTEECAACQLCIPFVMLLDPPVSALLPAAEDQPVMEGDSFASAPPTLAFKPPIF